jgi:hypothetical protein
VPAGEGERGPFGFVQLEFGFLLGPADGRYLTRAAAGAAPQRVIVLQTLGAPERRRLRGRRPKSIEAAEAEPVPTARATLIDARDLGAGAGDWLAALRGDRDALEAEVARALGELNAVLRAHRAAAADPYAREVARAQAIAVRVGYGSGEQVADGRFADAVAVPPPRERRRRLARLEPQERLAALLSRRDKLLACEELVLRARLDLDQGRPREAALQVRIALEAALAELRGSPHAEPLGEHRGPVGDAANAALAGELPAELGEAVEAAVAAIERVLRRRHVEVAGEG